MIRRRKRKRIRGGETEHPVGIIQLTPEEAKVVENDYRQDKGGNLQPKRFSALPEQVRKKFFKNFQVNSQVMKNTSRNAIFMHCLRAHRDEEVSSELIDSKRSVVWQQAQNRMYVQQAIILDLI